MKYIKSVLIVFLVFGLTNMAQAQSGTLKPPFPYNKKIKNTIKHVDINGSYIVINLSKAVDNTANCIGPYFGDEYQDNTQTGLIQTFYLDISTVEGKALFATVLTASSLKRKVDFEVSSCDDTTNLPIIDAIEVLF